MTYDELHSLLNADQRVLEKLAAIFIYAFHIIKRVNNRQTKPINSEKSI